MTDNHRKALRSWSVLCYCIAVFFILVLAGTLADPSKFDKDSSWYAGGGVVIFVISGTIARIIAACYK